MRVRLLIITERPVALFPLIVKWSTSSSSIGALIIIADSLVSLSSTIREVETAPRPFRNSSSSASVASSSSQRPAICRSVRLSRIFPSAGRHKRSAMLLSPAHANGLYLPPSHYTHLAAPHPGADRRSSSPSPLLESAAGPRLHARLSRS